MADRTMALAKAAFQRWRGGAVEFVSLRRSVRTAFFEVTTPDGVKANLQLVDPYRIESNIKWNDCDLSIEETPDEDRRYIVRDRAAHFEAVCAAVSIGNSDLRGAQH